MIQNNPSIGEAAKAQLPPLPEVHREQKISYTWGLDSHTVSVPNPGTILDLRRAAWKTEQKLVRPLERVRPPQDLEVIDQATSLSLGDDTPLDAVTAYELLLNDTQVGMGRGENAA